jgi:hypothetical protein
MLKVVAVCDYLYKCVFFKVVIYDLKETAPYEVNQ